MAHYSKIATRLVYGRLINHTIDKRCQNVTLVPIDVNEQLGKEYSKNISNSNVFIFKTTRSIKKNEQVIIF